MSTNETKAKALEKKLKKTLKEAFDKLPDEIVIFEPKEEGEFVIGTIADYGISKEYETPFLVLLDKNGDEITVFCKMGIVPKMRRKKWISIEDTWIVETIDENIGNLIAFQYLGEAQSDKSKRTFQKYKVMFPDELKKEGITSI